MLGALLRSTTASYPTVAGWIPAASTTGPGVSAWELLLGFGLVWLIGLCLAIWLELHDRGR